MAQTPVRVYSSTLPTADTHLYTVPAGKTFILKQVVVSNYGAAGTFNLGLNNIGLASGVAVGVGQVVTLDLSQVLAAGDYLNGSKDASSGIQMTISGVVSP